MFEIVTPLILTPSNAARAQAAQKRARLSEAAVGGSRCAPTGAAADAADCDKDPDTAKDPDAGFDIDAFFAFPPPVPPLGTHGAASLQQLSSGAQGRLATPAEAAKVETPTIAPYQPRGPISMQPSSSQCAPTTPAPATGTNQGGPGRKRVKSAASQILTCKRW
jgi:hypothetical protein